MPRLTPRTSRRRKLLLGGLVIAILAAALIVASRWPRAEDDRPPSVDDAPILAPFPLTVRPGVHLLGGMMPAAAYVVETSQGLVLIDSGMESDAATLKVQMAGLGLNWQRLHVILLTHGHADHCLGAQHLRKATGAKIYAGRDDSGVLKAGGPREALFSIYHMPQVKTHPTTVDVDLKGGEALDFGDTRFRVLATPGHTPGSICYLLERNNQRMLFSGDVIMQMGGEGKPSPLGTYAAYLAPRYRGNARAFLASLRKLRDLPAPDLILPGHPSSDQPPRSPAISPQRWKAILDEGIAEMAMLVSHHEKEGVHYLDGDPKKLLADLYYLGDFQGGPVYVFVSASKLFVVDAPGGPGLCAFMKTRLQQLGVKPALPSAVLLTGCGPKETAGLKELLENSHAQVVAAPAGLSQIKEECPAGTVVISTADLSDRKWFTVQSIPLRGRGLAPVAYQISWADKKVLFSGGIPIGISQTTVEALSGDFRESRGNRANYRDSLDLVADLNPDLWLPALPAHGQNANLYEGDWANIIAKNRQLFQ